MKQKPGFVLRQVCGENVIVAEGIGTVDFSSIISLNETAAYLWKKAAEMDDITAERLADALCEEYDVAHAEALKDAAMLIEQWQKAGIVE